LTPKLGQDLKGLGAVFVAYWRRGLLDHAAQYRAVNQALEQRGLRRPGDQEDVGQEFSRDEVPGVVEQSVLGVDWPWWEAEVFPGDELRGWREFKGSQEVELPAGERPSAHAVDQDLGVLDGVTAEPDTLTPAEFLVSVPAPPHRDGL
jgi:hypothetical protein